MKSFESPIERIMMYEMYNKRLNDYAFKTEKYSESYTTKMVNYGKKIKKRILKK